MKRFYCSLSFSNIQITALLSFMLLVCIGIQTAQAAESDYLITKWKTDNPGSSNDTQITLPMISGYWGVDWGDGSIYEDANSGPKTHTYAVAGTYVVKISVRSARINFKDSGDKEKILSIDQWGTSPWGNFSFYTSMEYAFAYLPNLQVVATDTPNFTNINNMRAMFLASPRANPITTNWDTSAVISMNSMFNGATAADPDVSLWNTALVTDMRSMFKGATTANPDVSLWNTGRVNIMDRMFEGATVANPDVSGWNTGSLTHALRMFAGATSFDRDLGAWNVRKLDHTFEMFDGIALSTPNYDKLLIGWSNQTLVNYVYFYAGRSVYCSDEAAAARDLMKTIYKWEIYDGGRCPPPPDDPVTAPDMTDGSDSGSSDADNVTNVAMPDFDMTCSNGGNSVTLYTDNPVADTAMGTWACSATASLSSALDDGIHNISYTEQNATALSSRSPSLAVIIDTLAPPQPACSTTPTPALIGATVTTSCTAVEEFAFVTIPNMQCAPSPADATGTVECTGIVGVGEGEVSKSDDDVTVTDLAGNINSNETTGLDTEIVFLNGFE